MTQTVILSLIVFAVFLGVMMCHRPLPVEQQWTTLTAKTTKGADLIGEVTIHGPVVMGRHRLVVETVTWNGVPLQRTIRRID